MIIIIIMIIIFKIIIICFLFLIPKQFHYIMTLIVIYGFNYDLQNFPKTSQTFPIPKPTENSINNMATRELASLEGTLTKHSNTSLYNIIQATMGDKPHETLIYCTVRCLKAQRVYYLDLVARHTRLLAFSL